MQYQLELIRASGNINKDDLNNSHIYKILLNGNFVMEITEEFTLLITTLFQGGMRKLVFDMGNLKYIDSTGIGIFINLTKLLRTKGGDICFLNVPPKILEVLNLVKLNEFIKFFKSDKQVVEHLFSLTR